MLVARALKSGHPMLLFDLLTSAEELDRVNVFDIPLLAGRLVDVLRWLEGHPSAAKLPLGLFGASTGAAAALVAAARLPRRVGAVVSRGGRPDLAGGALDQVHAPTLLIVGGADFGVIDLNEHAMSRLRGPKSLQIIPDVSHLFPEPLHDFTSSGMACGSSAFDAVEPKITKKAPIATKSRDRLPRYDIPSS